MPHPQAWLSWPDHVVPIRQVCSCMQLYRDLTFMEKMPCGAFSSFSSAADISVSSCGAEPFWAAVEACTSMLHWIEPLTLTWCPAGFKRGFRNCG